MSPEVTALFDRLSEPFSWDDVEVKVQSLTQAKDKALPVAYMDARCVRRRLNEVFGHCMWTATHRELFQDGKIIGVVCKITVNLPDGTTVEREEVGTPSDIEPIKGAYSDSLKRAFAAFGNDHLYHINLGWHPYTGNKYKPFLPAVLANIRKQYDKQIAERQGEGYIHVPESFYEDEEAPANGKRTRADSVAEKLGVTPSADDELSERWR